MNLKKVEQRIICFVIMISLMITSIMVVPVEVKAAVRLPFEYEGIYYRNIGSTPEESEDQVVLKTLNANPTWIPGTSQTLNRHWIGVAKTAYAAQFGADGLTRFLDIDALRKTLPLYHSESKFNYTRYGASKNDAAGYLVEDDAYESPGAPPEALYASDAAGALDGMMQGIMNASRKIGQTEAEQLNPELLSYYAVAPDGLREELEGISGPAAYSWCGNFIQHGTKTLYAGNYAAIGVIYSNFRLTPVLPDNIGIQTSGEAPQPGKDQEATGVFNATGSEIDVSQTLTETHSDTASNSISKTSTLSFSEGLSISHTASAGLSIGSILNVGSEITTTASFTAEQALETAWSNEKAISDEKSTTRTVGLRLPPYTQVNLKQENTSWNTTTTYECPVYVTYDVTCVVFCRDPGSPKRATPKSAVVCSLKNDAVKDFLKRFVLTGSASDPDQVSWSLGLKNLYREDDEDDEDGKNRVTELKDVLVYDNYTICDVDTDFTPDLKRSFDIYKRLSQNRPCILSGGTLSYTRKGVAYTIDGISPYYPLTQIKTGDTRAYTLQAGEELNAETIPVYGYNSYDGDFYGFQARKGNWTMLDQNGKETLENDTAVFKEDKVSGYHYIEGKEAGKVYLKYTPDSSKYTKGMVGEEASLTIPVTVKALPEKEKKYVIQSSGALSVYLNEPVDLNTADGIKAYVEDENEIILSNILDWEAKDQTSNAPIKIEKGIMKISEPGVYKVRPTYTIGTNKIVAKDWITVSAGEVPILDSITFRMNDTKEGVLTDDTKKLTYDLMSMISCKDQKGNDWSGSIPDVSFTLEQVSDGAYIDSNKMLHITKAGTYTIRATVNGYDVEPVTIKVKDQTTKLPEIYGITPETRYLEASGGKITFQVVGENMKDGIQVRSGKVRGWTTGKSTVQKVVLDFPVNKYKNNEKTYSIEYSYDGLVFHKSNVVIHVDHVQKGALKETGVSKGKLSIKWKKDTHADGYQIQTAWNKRFTKESRKISIMNYKKSSVNLARKRNHTYYIRIRNFQKDGKDRIYGNWSKIKKIDF